MKRWISIVALTVLLAMSLMGCGGREKQEASAPADSGAQTEKAPEKETEKAGGGPLEDLLAKATKVTDMSFDMFMTMEENPSFNTSGKIYISGDKTRMEMEAMGVKMITITNEEGDIYMYDPDRNSAMKMTAQPATTDLPNEWAEEDISAMKVEGEEKIDGADCLIVSLTEEGTVSKMWLRKDNGLPVKIEIPDEGVLIEYKNYDTGAQDPALFEIPANAEVIEMP
jgi:outer membrane lipoprotein-sorting protein